MKKMWSVLLCGVLLAGCSSGSGDPSKSLTIGGSTSIQPLMEQLAETYNKEENENVSVQGGGSSVGIKGTIDGAFEIGMVSRALRPNESKDVQGITIALDGIILITNKSNPISDLSLKQVKDIFTGKITNWKEVGGKDLEIAVLSREEGSGTRDGFESIVGFKSDELIPNAGIQNATGAIISSVSGNPNAIGYISMGSISKEVKNLKVEGVEASEETVANQTYKLQRPFILCTAHESEEIEAFYSYLFSEKGKQIIRDHNYVPVERE